MTLELGQVLSTPGVLHSVHPVELNGFLARHKEGDWGIVCKEDWESNDSDAATGEGRILSAYVSKSGIKVWIITEWDRSATTLLLPEEY